MVKIQDRSHRSIVSDRRQRSKQNWERGKGAKKIGNPRYKSVSIVDKNGNNKKVYVVRKPRKNEKTGEKK